MGKLPSFLKPVLKNTLKDLSAIDESIEMELQSITLENTEKRSAILIITDETRHAQLITVTLDDNDTVKRVIKKESVQSWIKNLIEKSL